MKARYLSAMLLALTACSSTVSDPVKVTYYQPVYRTSPPDSVYSRVMWSNLPHPIQPRAKANAPLILPTVTFDMPNATFDQAIEALAQSLGYRWDYPNYLAKKKIRIRITDGSVEQVLAEINRQANTNAMLDHERRIVRVVDGDSSPKLPR